MTDILKSFLKKYVLWTPQQREVLAHFYTNKQALETGTEDLFGVMRRMMGYRVDICPFYATQQELFETFMFHAPKQGKEFKEIIENWIEENKNAYQELEEKLNEVATPIETENDDESTESQDLEWETAANQLINSYPIHEQFFIKNAIQANPAYVNFEKTLSDFYKIVDKIMNSEGNKDDVRYYSKQSKEEHFSEIRYLLKKKRHSLNPKTEEWLKQENNKNVLLNLRIMLSIKIYSDRLAYARYRILLDTNLWNHWRVGDDYESKEIINE